LRVAVVEVTLVAAFVVADGAAAAGAGRTVVNEPVFGIASILPAA